MHETSDQPVQLAWYCAASVGDLITSIILYSQNGPKSSLERYADYTYEPCRRLEVTACAILLLWSCIIAGTGRVVGLGLHVRAGGAAPRPA